MADEPKTEVAPTQEAEDVPLLGGDDAPANNAPPQGDAPLLGEADEGKGEEGKGEEGKGEEGKADETPAGAPEEYADFELPEGVEVSDEELKAFKEVAKELNLTQDAAQKLAEYQAKQTLAAAEAFKAERQTWRDQIKSDPNYKQNLAWAKRALNGAPEDAAALFTKSHLGDHPAVVAFLAHVGKQLGEAPVVESDGQGKAPQRAADVLFGTKNAAL